MQEVCKNWYAGDTFKEFFPTTEIGKRVHKDFDFVHYSTVYDDYEVVGDRRHTLRQLIGDKSIAGTRMSAVLFYYINLLLETNPKEIHDIGCGWNIFKRYYPHIVGWDIKNLENTHNAGFADHYTDLSIDWLKSKKHQFDSAMSTCALHFNPIEQIDEIVEAFVDTVKPGGRALCTFNLKQMLQRSEDPAVSSFKTNRFLDKKDETKLINYINDKLQPLQLDYVNFEIPGLGKSTANHMDGNLRMVVQR